MSPDKSTVLKTMIQLEQVNTRAKVANRVALETEKEKDTVEKAVEELKRRIGVISMFSGLLPNHDRVHSQVHEKVLIITVKVRTRRGSSEGRRCRCYERRRSQDDLSVNII